MKKKTTKGRGRSRRKSVKLEGKVDQVNQDKGESGFSCPPVVSARFRGPGAALRTSRGQTRETRRRHDFSALSRPAREHPRIIPFA